MSHKVSSELLQRTQELYDTERLTPSQAAERLGISHTHVYRAWSALQLPLSRDRERTEYLVGKLYARGLPYDLIAQQSNISKTHVYLVLANLGVDLDKRGQRLYNPEAYLISPPREVWLAEFRGLFYGEGCVILETTLSDSFRPALHISMRADEKAMLEEIYTTLGGYFQSVPQRGNHNAQWKWSAYGWPRCKAIVETAFLAKSPALPAKKQIQIQILYQAILARYEMPYCFSDANKTRLRSFYNHLRSEKKFRL